MDRDLRRIADAVEPLLNDEEKEAAAEWIEDLYNAAEPYGLVMDTEIMETVKFLRGQGKKDEDDRKPAAAGGSM